jgi:hypothetical protein
MIKAVANAGGTTSRTKVRRVKRLGNQEMRVRVPPRECSLRTASHHTRRHGPTFSSRRMPIGLHAFHAPGAGSNPAGPSLSARSLAVRAGMSDQNLVAVNQFKLANAGGTTLVKAARPKRFKSAKGLTYPRRQHRTHRRMPAGLHVNLTVAGSNPAGPRARSSADRASGMSRHNLVAGTARKCQKKNQGRSR